MSEDQVVVPASILAEMRAFLDKKNGKKVQKVKAPNRLTDEQKAKNAKANEEAAEAAFTKAGFKDNKARETIRTYNGWLEAGRKVKKGEKGLKIRKGGYALFHQTQTEPLVSETKH